MVTRDEGTVFFYSMATSFTTAALSAEGLGKPTRMLIGNGYFPGHAETALDLVRENAVLRGMLELQSLQRRG